MSFKKNYEKNNEKVSEDLFGSSTFCFMTQLIKMTIYHCPPPNYEGMSTELWMAWRLDL